MDKHGLRQLYYGSDAISRRFRFTLLVFDIATIGLFLATTFVDNAPWVIALDFCLAAIIATDLGARFWIATNRREFVLSLWTIADVVVLFSLLAPVLTDNLGFLRIARAVRLLRSYHVLRDLRGQSAWFRANEEVIKRTLNLFVFIFVVTSAVFVTQHEINPGITNYIDALYFTITTLTTTGFGDITLQGPGGRLLSVVIMVIGVSLFLQLLQAIFRPRKVRHRCPDCALLVHDADAVHCKHCGRVLAIPNES